MSRNTHIGTDTSGRATDVGGSTSGGKAGDEPPAAFGGEVRTGDNPFSAEDVDQARPEQIEGTPEDLKPGTRRTVGMDEDAGAGQPDVSGEPGSTTGG